MQNIGFKIRPTRDLKQEVLLTELSGDYQNTVQWVKDKYHIENENYAYCVARETIKLIADCLENNIALNIDLTPKFTFLWNENTQNIFDVQNNDVEYTDTLWLDIFATELGRIIKISTIEKVANAIAKGRDLFVKSDVKGFSQVILSKDFNKIENYVLQLMRAGHYGYYFYPFEDCGVEFSSKLTDANLQIFKNGVGEEQYKILFIRSYLTLRCSASVGLQNILASEVLPFQTKNEFRCIFVGNKIHSIAERVDYPSKKIHTEEIYKIVENYCQELADRYYNQVPYKVWNVDVCLVNNKPYIVEAHLHCKKLGHFLNNQDYVKYIDIFCYR